MRGVSWTCGQESCWLPRQPESGDVDWVCSPGQVCSAQSTPSTRSLKPQPLRAKTEGIRSPALGRHFTLGSVRVLTCRAGSDMGPGETLPHLLPTYVCWSPRGALLELLREKAESPPALRPLRLGEKRTEKTKPSSQPSRLCSQRCRKSLALSERAQELNPNSVYDKVTPAGTSEERSERCWTRTCREMGEVTSLRRAEAEQRI